MHSDTIDTNIILRILLNDIPAQRQLAIALLNMPDTVHYLSDLAISETVYVLEHTVGQSREEISSELNFFFTHYSERILYNQSLFTIALPIYVTHPKLSFTDCCLATQAELVGAEPLFTFDKKLATQHPSAKLLA